MTMTLEPTDWVGDYETESSDLIQTQLNLESLQWALEQSHSLKSSSIEVRWQRYLNGLAVAGLRQWLLEHEPSLTIDYISLYPCAILQINQLRVGVLPQGSTGGTQIELPQAAIASSSIPDCYVRVDVEEELKRVIVRGMLPQTLLTQQQQKQPLSTPQNMGEWPIYLLPRTWFSKDPERLLLYLRCGRPELLRNASPLPEARNTHDKTGDLITTSSILNVAHWFRDGLSDVSQGLQQTVSEGLDWILMPGISLEPSPMMSRELSLTASLDSMLQQLVAQGILTIPSAARGAAYPLQVSGMDLCLHAVTWPILTHPNHLEWSLILFLSQASGEPLQPGLKLQMADESQVLVSALASEQIQQSYLYGQVIGDLAEQFFATLFFPDGTQYHFPAAFTFQPDPPDVAAS